MIEKKGISAYTLKMIAIIGMAMQHTALVLGEVIPAWLHFPLQFGGGFTFPIMAFFVVEGYKHTSNLKKYMGRILIFALISQIPYMIAFESLFLFGITFNIMFTIFIGLLMLVLYDKMKIRWLFWVIFVIVSIATIFADWGIVGIVMILMYHIIKSDKARKIATPIVAGSFTFVFGIIVAAVVAVMMIVSGDPIFADAFGADTLQSVDDAIVGLAGLMFPLGSFASIAVLLNYNGQRGRNMKYMFYVFYPLHFVVLALLAFALGIGTLYFF